MLGVAPTQRVSVRKVVERLQYSPNFKATENARGCGGPKPKPSTERKKRNMPVRRKELPEMEDATVMVKMSRLKELLAPCDADGGKCCGRRQIIDQSVLGHGGCCELVLECCWCSDTICWQSGTEYSTSEGDGRTRRYTEATLLQLGHVFAGSSLAQYSEIGASINVSTFSKRSL